jgi:hypothetical protein
MSIDELLSQPLASVPDDGFSARIMGRVRAAERRRMVLIGAGSAAAATLVCLFVPLQAMTVQLNQIVVALGTSTALGVGGAALLLTILFDRRFFRI